MDAVVLATQNGATTIIGKLFRISPVFLEDKFVYFHLIEKVEETQRLALPNGEQRTRLAMSLLEVEPL